MATRRSTNASHDPKHEQTEREQRPRNRIAHVPSKISAEGESQRRPDREIIDDLDVHKQEYHDSAERIKERFCVAFVRFLARIAKAERAQEETQRGHAVGIEIPVPNRHVACGHDIQAQQG